MKILAISNLYPPDGLGGYELGCSQMVNALRRQGDDVLVLTGALRGETAAEENVDRSLALVDVYSGDTRARPGIAESSRRELLAHLVIGANVRRLVRELEAFRPDVCYIWNLEGLGGIGLIATLNFLGVPWVWHLMDATPLVLCHTRGRLIDGLAAEFAIELAKGQFISCSDRLVREIETGGVLLPSDIALLPVWVEEGPHPLPPRPRHRPLRLVNAGQIREHKGIGLILEAVALLRDRGWTQMTVDFYGEGAIDDFRALALSLGVGHYVAFYSGQPQRTLRRTLRDYDVFLFPTWEREPGGFAPLEAAAAGCLPVISSSCGIAEWLVDGVDCVKIRRTSDAIADCVEAILLNEMPVQELQRRAHHVAMSHFHIMRVSRRVRSILSGAAEPYASVPSNAHDAIRLATVAEGLVQQW